MSRRNTFVVLVLPVFTILVIAGLLLACGQGRSAAEQTRPRRAGSQSGKMVTVKAGGDLQAAINNAEYGDTIVLEAGKTYESSGASTDFAYSLPDKGAGRGTDADYITIQSSAIDNMPEGQRVSASDAQYMPKVVINRSGAGFRANSFSHHYKFVGLEITNKDATNFHTSTFFESQSGAPGSHPHHIVIDRCFIHPIEETTDPTSVKRSATRAMFLDGAEITLMNSRIAGFGGVYRYGNPELIDSEAFAIVAGPGPYHIINNLLDAWFANFFLGGGGFIPIPANTGTVKSSPAPTSSSATLSSVNNLNVGDRISFPQTSGENANAVILTVNGTSITFTPPQQYDPKTGNSNAMTPVAGTTATWNGQQIDGVEIRGNTFNKDVKFKLPGAGGPKGYFEIKNGNNIVIDGNIFQGFPTGWAFLTANQNSSGPWSSISNLTITNNIVRDFSDAFIYTGRTDAPDRMTSQSKHVIVANNLILGGKIHTADEHQAKFAQIYGGYDVQIYHNTILGAGTGIIYSNNPPTTGLVFRDNIVSNGEYGMGCFLAPNTLETCWPRLVMSKNVILDNRRDRATPPVYPGTQFFVGSLPEIGFVDYANGNYALGPTSKFKGKATDGKDIGVDFAALSEATQTKSLVSTR